MTGDAEYDRDDGREPDDADDGPPPKPWGSRAQVVAAVLWPSFLAACVATMLFFAYVDPGMIHGTPAPEVRATRMSGYGIGFFFFWFVAILASSVSAYLIRTSHLGHNERDDGEPR